MHEHARRTEDAGHSIRRASTTTAADRTVVSADVRSPASIAALQRRVGNAAVIRMLARDVLRSPGQPLDESTRTEMQARLGADFSSVRVHSGPLAQRSATQLGARAYTSGEHVVIGPGGADRHTLAHELTHVVQQRAGQVDGTDNGAGYRVSDPADRFEVAAERNARRVLSGPTPDAVAGGPEPEHGRETGSAAVQRSVGFEFETTAETLAVDPGLRTSEREGRNFIKQFQSRGVWEGRAATDPNSLEYMGRGLTKKETIANVANLFTVEADEASNGGSDLEFVTAAFPENAAGLARLQLAMTLITAVAQHLSADGAPVFDGRQVAGWVSGRALPVSGPGPTAGATGKKRGTIKKLVSSERAREYAVKNVGSISARPQTTAGVLLSRIPDLMREITTTPAGGQPPINPMAFEDMGRGQVQARALQQVNGYLGAGFVVPSADPQQNPPAPPSAELRGLLTLIATYLIPGAAPRGPSFVKGIAPLLARTDFATIYAQLPEAEKINFKADPGIFIDLALHAAGMPTADAPVVAGLIGAAQVNIRHVTRRTWLQGMVDGTDLMSSAGYAQYDWGRTDNAELSQEFESMGAMGAKMDPDDKPIMELRRMQPRVPFDQWGTLAVTAFEIIRQVNA
jgi:hypothetical protein